MTTVIVAFIGVSRHLPEGVDLMCASEENPAMTGWRYSAKAIFTGMFFRPPTKVV